MPPGPAYNWLCVASSVCNILSHSAQIRAAQLARTGRVLGVETTSPVVDHRFAPTPSVPGEESIPGLGSAPTKVKSPTWDEHVAPSQVYSKPEPIKVTSQPARVDDGTSAVTLLPSGGLSEVEVARPVVPVPEEDSRAVVLEPPRNRNLQSSKVPSSRVGRLFHYGGLAASLGFGAASELIRRTTHSSDGSPSASLMLTEGNVKRLVSKLTQMRGAALKLGQFMSIQDSHVLPPEIEDIFRRVQDSAHYMPDWQMERVMHDSLGPTWMSNFDSFDRLPFAAASIGQVHSAVLSASASPTGKAEPVAVKIQFPNIVNSINSDLGYVKMLLTAGRLLPPGLFLDRTIQVMKEELADECNYSREASFLRRFREGLSGDGRFKVPWVWEGSTDKVLVMEKVDGVSVGGATIEKLSQRDRDDIATRVIDLCLRELFVLRAMQTDPNWTNFLWNARTRQVELVDFGAAREYTKDFIDDWLRLLSAAVVEDHEACIKWSLKLGYLTGGENELMRETHVRSMILLGTPFKASTQQPFRFGQGTEWADITAEIREQIPVMLKHRLTPPPRETYSLNRKLSGAFLLASRLNASVDCRSLWTNVADRYRFD